MSIRYKSVLKKNTLIDAFSTIKFLSIFVSKDISFMKQCCKYLMSLF